MSTERAAVHEANGAVRARPAVGLVAPLPPDVGGVAGFADWLLRHSAALGCEFVAFDLGRPAPRGTSGRLGAAGLVRQARVVGRFLAWLPGAPRVVHLAVSYTRTGVVRDLALAALLRAGGRRTIAHVHMASLPEGDRLVAGVLRWISRLAAETVAIAPSAATSLRMLGIRPSWVVNPPRLAPSNGARPPGEPGRLSVLFAGRYGASKGTDVLLRALAHVRETGFEVDVRLVGAEEFRGEEAWLRELAEELGVAGAVRFDGVATAGGLARLYAEADAFCLPSLRDGLPMALLEARSFGLPVVASRIGAVEDVVADGESGIVVEPADVEALAQALGQLARSPELRATLGSGARARVAEVAAPEAVLARWREIYRGQGLELAPSA